MTKLECSVRSCVHNTDNCCCKAVITMGGNGAKPSEQACCASFDENKGARFANLFKTPGTRLEIACDAIKCVYNGERRCSAERIDISRNGVCDYAEAKCNTFRARQGCREYRGSGVSSVSMWGGQRGRKRTRGGRGS